MKTLLKLTFFALCILSILCILFILRNLNNRLARAESKLYLLR